MAAVVILFIFAVFIGILILFLKSTRGSLIEKMDDQGLTTKSGRFYHWNDLERIEFFLATHRVSDKKKVHSVHFFFKTGKVSAGYLMRNIDAVIEKANQLQVPKTEKIVGAYLK